MINPDWYVMAIRLFLALVFGGAIGFERESPNRPAGFRTHILVCVGAALIMVTSEFIFSEYRGQTNLDPARLGAQVISGIGFLGAGTIIKDKFKVRGLTTAASLWSVACIGLAVGSGYYAGSAVATILIIITLMVLKKMEKSITKKRITRAFYITTENRIQNMEDILDIFDQYGITIETIDFIRQDNNGEVLMKILYSKQQGDFDKPKLVMELYNMDGVSKVTED